VGDEKQSFTALCSITDARRVLSMAMIAKWKTIRVQRIQLGKIEPILAMHSESGLIAIPSFKEYLAMLKHEFPDDEPMYFVLNCYSVHRNQEVQQHTRD
jgi:hypothetical protein